MDFNQLKEQATEQFKDLWQKINENETVIQLIEKYKGLSPLVQKIIVGASACLVLYLFYTIPSAFLSSASYYEDNFEYNRSLIRGLFRAARSPAGGRDEFSGLSYEQMQSMVNTQLRSAQVLDKQKGSFRPAQRPLPSKMVPSAINQDGMVFEIKKLNLKQVTEISERIASMHPNTKLAAISIQADQKDPHYFNVIYTLSSLSLPGGSSPETSKSPFKKRN